MAANHPRTRAAGALRKRHAANARPGKRASRPDVLLIRQLREENLFLRKQFKFYQGKCERLELSLLEAKAGPAAAYVDRTESARSPIADVEIHPKKLRHTQVLEAWNKLSAEEQDKHIAAGDWQLEPEEKKKKKEMRH